MFLSALTRLELTFRTGGFRLSMMRPVGGLTAPASIGSTGGVGGVGGVEGGVESVASAGSQKDVNFSSLMGVGGETDRFSRFLTCSVILSSTGVFKLNGKMEKLSTAHGIFIRSKYACMCYVPKIISQTRSNKESMSHRSSFLSGLALIISMLISQTVWSNN